MLQQTNTDEVLDGIQAGGYAGCDICGEDSDYRVCDICGAKKEARQIFMLCFVEELGLMKVNNIDEQRRKRIIQNVKRVWKNRLVDPGLSSLSKNEQTIFQNAFEKEYELLEKNQNFAYRVMHFDATNNKFTRQEINWYGDMRNATIYRHCGACCNYPCALTKSYSKHIREIINCSKSRQ